MGRQIRHQAQGSKRYESLMTARAVASTLTVGLHEKIRLHSVDFLAAVFGFALKSCPTGRRPALRGRTYDLRSAYKQFAVHPLDRASLRMGVNVPGSKSYAMIGFNSLPLERWGQSLAS